MMRQRSWVIVVLCLSVSQLFSQLSSASTAFHVNEAAIRIALAEETTKVSLAVTNPTGDELKARVLLEVLDPQGALRASSETDELLKRGSSALSISLPLKLAGLSDAERNAVLWYRLRYLITTEHSAPADASRAEGIVSLSEITPDLFELRVAASERAHEGMHYHARARAIHPVSSRAVAGVNVEGELTFDEGKNKAVIKSGGVTDADGYAPLDFDLPKQIEGDDEMELKVRASHGGLSVETEEDISLQRDAFIMLTTDKTLYQPGQTLHMRALCFDGSKHALSNISAQLTVADPEDKTVFSAPLSTSRFGVASLDWPIPESTRLGDYVIKLELDGDRYSDQQARQIVKLSRYELPNFAVNVRPDRAFYLPGQAAEVEVRADYLFGQPVKRGHVRVVREEERNWNYQAQKWETKEAENYEGETGADGRFTAHINLTQEHASLADEDYSRFHDLTYAAYFTDPTTNRTEQRRFSLRLTKDAIHIYVFSGIERQTKNFPLQFYLSTYYADGTPAECDVEINAASRSGDSQHATVRPLLRTIRTNRFGVAKVEALALPKLDDDKDTQSVSLNFVAHDKTGASGSQANDFWLSGSPVIRLETDKALYRAGAPVKATITASEPRMKLVVDVWRGELALRSQTLELHDGQARITIPYSADFKDGVTLTAYAAPDAQTSSYELPAASRNVLYPRERDLRLDVRLSRESYRPGDDAHADFSVSAPGGGAVESALGVVVFDKAVEERARTNSEFGSNQGFYEAYRYLNGYDGTISGVGGEDLFKLDISKPVPADLGLVAEILLRTYSHVPSIFGGDSYEMRQRRIFSKVIEKQTAPLKEALDKHYALKMEYPQDVGSLRAQLKESGISFERLLDPWGTPYRARFYVAQQLDVIDLKSAGADKRFETDDDFTAIGFSWPYFRPLGERINRAAADYHARTGSFIRDRATLKDELRRAGIELDALRDRWGQPYRFDFAVKDSNYLINIMSGGADARFDQRANHADDNFNIWTTAIDYFDEARARIDKALADYARSTKLFPQTDAELRSVLSRAGINLDDLSDPWGHHYDAIFSRDALFVERHVLRTYSVYGESEKLRQEVTPVIQRMNHIYLRSRGADNVQGTADDFNVANYSRLLVAESAPETGLPNGRPRQSYAGATGAVSGTIFDPQGAVIPNAQVTAMNIKTAEVFQATSDDAGRYLLRNLPVGFYRLEFTSTGFSMTVIDKVPVQSSNLTKLDSTLAVGAVSSVVTITADAGANVDVSSNTVGANVSTEQFSNFPTQRTVQSLYSIAPAVARSGLRNNAFMVTKSGSSGAEYGKGTGGVISEQMETPRLRENFSETLLWQPSLETDGAGHAQLDFKLADNITTWKMAVVSSTIDGEIGIAEREFQAFQPFFVEHDPPRVLTEGDEIQLPVVVRNYLDKAQDVNLKIAPASWFTLLGPSEKRVAVEAGDSARQTFDFRAVAAVHEGGQMITAEAEGTGDRILKPITVHPDGEETAVTDSQLINASATLNLTLPRNVIDNSLRAELKIYPNLMVHVLESIEAILRRPYGCGEQTISSTYPSLLVLKYDRRTGKPSAIAPKALSYLRAGYGRLLNYRAAGGGFSYWGGREDADLALTAYALRFLNDAKEFIAVDEDVIEAAREWLVKQQQPEGYWRAHYHQPGDNRPDLMLTAYIARVLAANEAQANNARPQAQTTPAQEAVKTPDSSSTQTAAPGQSKPASPVALERALRYLSRRAGEMNEPYLLAAYALAARDAGDSKGAERATASLRALVHELNGESSWSIDTSTPFYGWGLAGNIETTALVVQALARENRADALVGRGLMFMLRRKDRYGVWYSTQATINVLDALIILLTGSQPAMSTDGRGVDDGSNDGGPIDVIVNGRHAVDVSLPSAGQPASLVNVDLTSYLAPGDNRIELQRKGSARPASVQAVATYYVPWPDAREETHADARAATSTPLRLKVSFDKSEVGINEEVTCKVVAERTGQQGYGMLLAEIGLPPGADVDRASLEKAMTDSQWALSRYDILPDRLTVYLWPRTGGTTFEFKFRPRYGLRAQTSASQLYDYYNPEARVVVAPTKFVVR